MMELNYDNLANEIIQKLEGLNQITFATCEGSRVFARTISPVNDGLTIYFGTGGKSEKARQMSINPNVAFAIDNIQIEAVAENVGHPDNHSAYNEKCAEKYPQYVTQYPAEPDDIVVIAKPTKITLYKYLGRACEEVLDIQKGIAYRIEL